MESSCGMDEKTPILGVLCSRRGIWMDLNKLDLLDVILVAGLPGSGKSWFAREYFAGKNRLRINRKEIRKSIYEMSHFGDVWKESYYTEKNEYLVKHVERKIFEQLLSNNEKVLIDNHSVTVESRRPYIETALAARKTIGIVSHVRRLAEEIPTQIRLEKEPGGSSRITVVA